MEEGLRESRTGRAMRGEERRVGRVGGEEVAERAERGELVVQIGGAVESVEVTICQKCAPVEGESTYGSISLSDPS